MNPKKWGRFEGWRLLGHLWWPKLFFDTTMGPQRSQSVPNDRKMNQNWYQRLQDCEKELQKSSFFKTWPGGLREALTIEYSIRMIRATSIQRYVCARTLQHFWNLVGWDVGTAKRKGKTVWRGGGRLRARLCWLRATLSCVGLLATFELWFFSAYDSLLLRRLLLLRFRCDDIMEASFPLRRYHGSIMEASWKHHGSTATYRDYGSTANYYINWVINLVCTSNELIIYNV
jgi:hypothetical protein